MLGEGWTYLATSLLAAWAAFLCWTCWRYIKTPQSDSQQLFRRRLNIAGMICSIAAVSSFLSLRLVWTSVEIGQHRLPWVFTENYQHLNVWAIKSLSVLWLASSLVGLLLGLAGTKRKRFLVVATSFAAALWWFFLPGERHPARYVIPEGFVGWVEIKYGRTNAMPLPMDKGTLVYRIPDSGLLETSMPLEYGIAKDEFISYSKQGSVRTLKSLPWVAGNLIWGTNNSQTEEFFFVGTEEQFRNGVSTGRESPFQKAIPDPKYP